MRMTKFRVGIDNYSLFPLKLSPLETLQWAKDHRAEGVSFSCFSPDELHQIDDMYLRELSQFAESSDLYLEWGGAEHIPRDLSSWAKKDVFVINEKVADQAEVLGVQIVRSCSGGLMRWDDDSPMTETLLQDTAAALRAQKQMLLDHNVTLAIETHFEFTTHELLRLFELCDAEPGGWLGICLDTMNLPTMLEHPVLATERILPWVVTTHIKDGGLRLTADGLESFAVGIGTGVIDFEKIMRRFKTLTRDIPLSIEGHGGSFALPIFDPLFLSKFPDVSTSELAQLIQLAVKTQDNLNSGYCAVVDRNKWPELCERRISHDILALHKINNELE